MAGKQDGKAKRPIVIRREEVVEGGHHGGAWKVAYADFVTAMMAFFLLMWLLNATTESQRKGLADYFSPTNILSHNTSGNGQPFSGHTSDDNGALVSDRGAVQVQPGTAPVVDAEDEDVDTIAQPHPHRLDKPTTEPDADQATAPAAGPSAMPVAAPRLASGPDAAPLAGRGSSSADGLSDAARPDTPPPSAATEQARFETAARAVRAAIAADPALAGLARQLAVDLTPEGLRIQILDEDGRPMFANGSNAPNDRARDLIRAVAPVLAKLPEPVSIAGHTDAKSFAGVGRSNWELSTDRAHATRRLLVEAGLPEARIRSVSGNAERDPLLPADPMAAANRRIAIVVLRSASPPAVAP